MKNNEVFKKKENLNLNVHILKTNYEDFRLSKSKFSILKN